MSTLIENAKSGKITDSIRKVAKMEGVDPERLRISVAEGRTSIPVNHKRKGVIPKGIGENLTTKVNANIGSSQHRHSVSHELKKLKASLDAGTDAVMDLSTGGDIRKIRRSILENCPVPLGTVPVYEAFVRSIKRGARGASVASDPAKRFDPDEMLEVIQEQAEEGVDFMTIHAGLNRVALERLRHSRRVTGIVSRGGALLASWMQHTGNENPLFERFDEVLKIVRKYDVAISLGDGLRPGCLADASDRPQIQEMIFLGELAQRCLDAGVQAIIEGPGHMPLDTIAPNIQLEKSLCNGAPYYVLGPLVTDVAPGYDHITSAIGGAIAALAGADFLCYVTPSEHLGLPGPDDVKRGVIAARIAAHAADICKLNHRTWDREISAARKALDWDRQKKLSIDPSKFSSYKTDGDKTGKNSKSTCSMCGEYCAYLISPE